MRGFRIILLLALACPVPAFAADIATIGCVREETPAPAAAAIRESALSLADDSKSAETPESANRAVREAMLRCQARHKWSEAESRAALGYGLADIALEALYAVAREHGADPAAIRAAYESLPAELRATLGSRNPAATQAYLDRLEANGVSFMTNLTLLKVIGAIGGMLKMQEKLRDEFVG